MTGFEITCINRSTDGTVTRIAGNGWTLGVRDAVTKLITGQIRFNIRVDGRFWDVGVRGEAQSAYLVLEPSGLPLHELSTFPSC